MCNVFIFIPRKIQMQRDRFKKKIFYLVFVYISVQRKSS